MSDHVVVIPVRMGSSRLPGKPLIEINGETLLGRAFQIASSDERFPVYVATCDEAIRKFCFERDSACIMTHEDHNRATTRTAEAVNLIEQATGECVQSVLMVQGDEILIDDKSIRRMNDILVAGEYDFVNLLSRFNEYEDFLNVNNVKAVLSEGDEILYLSRQAIPASLEGPSLAHGYNQTGIIGFRRELLSWFLGLQESPLEVLESIDMNRVLERKKRIKGVVTESYTFGIDTIEDLTRARKILPWK